MSLSHVFHCINCNKTSIAKKNNKQIEQRHIYSHCQQTKQKMAQKRRIKIASSMNEKNVSAIGIHNYDRKPL